ncbi:MAG: hypothetical protein IPI84_01635 [Holophagaceae bacterium]|nr:hypothetical protein [Holophagaceae bacterium]
MTILHTLALTTLLAVPLAAQAPPTTPAPQAKEEEPDPAILKAMKSQVYVLQHSNPVELFRLLGPLGSGVKGARMSWTDREGLRALSVRDFPENLATIEAAIKRLDVPAAMQEVPDVELHIHVLFADKAAGLNAAVPEDLQVVLRTLRSTLAYRSFTPVASFVQRIQPSGHQTFEGQGQVDSTRALANGGKIDAPMTLAWLIRGIDLDKVKGQPPVFHLKGFELSVHNGENTGTPRLASFRTDLSLKDDETVVVGTSVVKGRGLIVVVNARRVR